MKIILHTQDEGQFGGKAGALRQLERARVTIPRWFVVSPDAFYASLTLPQRMRLETLSDAREIQLTIEGIKPSESVRREIEQALKELCPGDEPVAVRSSAIDEDGEQHSFAGQLESFLFVSPDQAAEKVAEVWLSAFSPRAIAYRRERGLSLAPNPPAVLIQRMVFAEKAGVAFSADPVTGRRSVAVVSAVRGIGATLVSGESDAETWRIEDMTCRGDRPWSPQIDRKALIERSISFQPGAGTEAPPLQDCERVLSCDEAGQIAELARRAERQFGAPQDIEWAIEGGQVFLLQSRPITSLAAMPDPDGELCIWDNSNIAESYGGVTTPLTFSFARRAYEEVYRQFCRILRVPESSIAAHATTFRRMIGLVRGRVYYNLLNWYEVLALLPGFRVNRKFMEQMMGVRERLPESVVKEIQKSNWRATVKDGFNLMRTVCSLAANHFLLGQKIRKFYRRLDEALCDKALDHSRADELAAHYRDLERRLLTRWDAPLINDFLAMIFYGLLGRVAKEWCGDDSLKNALICNEGGIISAEPARRVRRMAESVAEDEEFVALLGEGSIDQILRRIEEKPDFRRLFDDYLARFGDRCLDELKLESETLGDDPLPLFRAIGGLARRLDEIACSNKEVDLRADAESRARKSLAGHPLRHIVFRWVLKHARRRVRDRENLRFERTRLFGRVRRLFLELGRRFHALGRLDAPRDIFYLEVEEALGFVEGTATTTDLKSLVALRKAEYERHRGSEAPSDRFETRGIVNHANQFQATRFENQNTSGDQRRGIASSPGVRRGRARLIRDPRTALVRPGEILVAERTDPGWIMMFASAAGVVVERGSLLSHAAIVAREMGLPAIVAAKGVMEWLTDGDLIEIDGSTGTITRIKERSEVRDQRPVKTA